MPSDIFFVKQTGLLVFSNSFVEHEMHVICDKLWVWRTSLLVKIRLHSLIIGQNFSHIEFFVGSCEFVKYKKHQKILTSKNKTITIQSLWAANVILSHSQMTENCCGMDWCCHTLSKLLPTYYQSGMRTCLSRHVTAYDGTNSDVVGVVISACLN